MKASKKILATRTPETIREQNEAYKRLAAKGEALFTQAGACSFAANSAAAMWSSMEQYSRRPDPLGQKLNQRRQQDYSDNMELCKQSLQAFK
ncbi:hypothetical protein GMLC_15000 [Geomonas limicola]|uniref:Uncharacterized protein n=1 Tax=Geomonas limicola TaxID=2740186 RepID=A0A6V8N626_9BACT|nr:hypothetical protein GMLC_15000 [Geomonas limicola]